MTELENKYHELRKYAEDKDALIILCRSEGYIGRKICKITDSYYSHSLILYWCEIEEEMRLCIFEAQPDGAKPKFASDRILEFYTDICSVNILDSKLNIGYDLNKYLTDSEKGIKYDFGQIAKIAVYEWTNGKINLFKRNPLDTDDNKVICSELSWIFANNIGVKCYTKDKWIKPFFLPQHFITLANENDVEIKFYNKLRWNTQKT